MVILLFIEIKYKVCNREIIIVRKSLLIIDSNVEIGISRNILVGVK